MFQLSHKGLNGHMTPLLYSKVLQYLRLRLPFPIRSHIASGTEPPLLTYATFFDHVVIAQRRYWAASRNNNIANSLVAVATSPGVVSIGELIDIFVLAQPRLQRVFHFGQVWWLVPLTQAIPPASPWSSLYVHQ